MIRDIDRQVHHERADQVRDERVMIRDIAEELRIQRGENWRRIFEELESLHYRQYHQSRSMFKLQLRCIIPRASCLGGLLLLYFVLGNVTHAHIAVHLSSSTKRNGATFVA